MIISSRMSRHATALLGVAMCAVLPACNHRSGFSVPMSSQIAATSAGPQGPGSNPPGDKLGEDPGPTPRPALSLLDPVTGLLGKTVVATGEAAKDLTDVIPTIGPVDPLLNRVGDTVIDLGSGLRDDGVTGLPVVGGTLQNVSNTLDAAATVSVLDQAIGGATPALGIGVLSPALIDGSVGTIGLLSDGTLATVSLTPGAATGLAPAVLGGAPSGVLGSAAPILNPVSSLIGVTALNQQIGGSAPVIGVSALSASSAQGSLASVDVLAGGSVAGVALTGSPLSAISGPVTPVAGAVTGVVGAVTPNVGGGGGALGGLIGGGRLPIVGGLLGRH